MDKNLCTKNLITQNNNFEIKYNNFEFNQNIGLDKKVFININKQKYNDKQVDLISNPIIIFELNDDDLEFVPERIFNYIGLEIHGNNIDIIYDNQINILQKNMD